MRFATYDDGTGNGLRCGVVEGAIVHPLPVGTTLLGLLRLGPDGLRAAGERALSYPATALREDRSLRPPFEPPTLRVFSAFEEHERALHAHLDGTQAQVPPRWYDAPSFQFASPYEVVGPYDDVPVPPGSSAFDFGCGVGAVVGLPGRDLTPDRARAHIAGYVLVNDWTARDLHLRELRSAVGAAKGKDAATTLGPWLVTADEVDAHRGRDGFPRLALAAEVNGRTVGKGRLGELAWTFEELVAYASRGAWVRPGDVVVAGPFGGGCLGAGWRSRGEKVPAPLVPGDVVGLSAQMLGSTRNTVVPGRQPAPIPHARRRLTQ